MAHELNLFGKYGMQVTLHRELGWASIRDKVIYGELDAAHAIAAMPVAATLGLGSIRCDCLTALVLNLHGNAITLSNDLWHRGVRDGDSLREEIKRSQGNKLFTFGVVYPFSSHRHLLRKWLTTHGIDPERDVQMVVVPPAQMVPNLKAGNLDGFCVGEPWNSVAVEANVGWCVTTSAELSPDHPEKVLMVRREFAEKREAEHLALVAALLEALEFCERPENFSQIISTLAHPRYVGVAANTLSCGITGQFNFGHGVTRTVPNFCVFHRNNANEPSSDKAAWTLQVVRESGLCTDTSLLTPALGRRVFRPDVYDKALRLLPTVSISNPNQTEYETKHQNLAAV
ncbi:MAG: putative Nitrate transporter [Verrucomicrobiales bacterium]|nr:putative Nitrate transporter [Verrucomicrobiales bacterium]